jgi:LmbE family N-acetylglucosaminyl deacetylase
MGLHLFLSPHLDDAVLSCGGRIHSLTHSGERVVILTVMAGDPLEPLPDSPLIHALKDKWPPARQRRHEDAQAAAILGAQVYHMGLQESIFRKTVCGAGDWIALYPDYDSPFGDINEADEARLILFEAGLPFQDITSLYAPYCIDQHVDHRLVRDWALVLTGSNDAPELRFYEEYPHVRTKGAIQRARAIYRQKLPALKLGYEIVPLSEDDLAVKLDAMRCYRSHLHVLWDDMEQMEQLTRDYMINLGGGVPAEACWCVVR